MHLLTTLLALCSLRVGHGAAYGSYYHRAAFVPRGKVRCVDLHHTQRCTSMTHGVVRGVHRVTEAWVMTPIDSHHMVALDAYMATARRRSDCQGNADACCPGMCEVIHLLTHASVEHM